MRIFPSGPLATNTYVFACLKTNEAVLIDASLGSFDLVFHYLKQQDFKLKKILLTHSHWDHIADVAKFKGEYQVPVYVHALDAPNLQNPGADKIPFFCPIIGIKPDAFIEEGNEVICGELSLKVLHTPGHSPGCVCFYEASEQVLFSGDTLFKGAMGILSLPTSQPQLMQGSLQKLCQLPDQTKVYPGHGRETTIHAESAWIKAQIPEQSELCKRSISKI